MGKFFRALLVASAATAAAYVVIAAAGKAGREQDRSAKRPNESAEVEADDLPGPIREKLVAELDGHV